ncbi:MAG TPA: hypothetical protein PKY35_14720 [Candidatus Hydrogenedentes bacterium]|nr:hypothetical protein [Candidatus Hydrogenedentota bacterium]HOL78272.1 hypothetical protein [Candidatus Hydrogenedentota bacterium]
MTTNTTFETPKADDCCTPTPSPLEALFWGILRILLWPLYILGLIFGPLFSFPY